MMNNTQSIQMAGEVKSSGRTRKVTSAELSDFAQFFNLQITSSSQLLNLKNPEKTGGLFTGSGNSLQTKTERTGHDDAHQTVEKKTAEQDGKAASSQKNDISDDARSPLRNSESGQKQTGNSAEGVDGCVKGVQPGTSTEAAVNASSENGQWEQALPNSPEGEESGSAGENSIDQILGRVSPDASGTDAESAGEVKIAANGMVTKNPVFAPNLNLADQSIFFDSSLASNFIKLLTDQFDQVKSGPVTSGENANAGLQPVMANTSGASEKGIAGTGNPFLQLRGTDEKQTDNMNRILQVIRSNIGRRQSQMTVRLDPPELGKLRLDVKLVNNDLQLSVVTETPEAKDILLNRMDTLRASLEQNGITMSKCDVVAKSSEFQSNQNWSGSQDQSQGSNGGAQQQAFNQSGSHNNFEQYLPDSEETDNYDIPLITTVSLPDSAVNVVA